jgi:hypothetical protein
MSTRKEKPKCPFRTKSARLRKVYKPALILVSTTVWTSVLFAQSASRVQDIWKNVNQKTTKPNDNAKKEVPSVKKWKDHLQKWGLDTSYRYSIALSGRLNTDGWTGGLIYGHKRDLVSRTINLWSLSLSEVKHEKETHQQGTNAGFPEFGSGTSYIYGKINNLYLLQLMFEKDKQLLPALIEGNVAIGLRYGAGISLAMLKPYYLNLIQPDYSTSPATATIIETRFTDPNKEQFLAPQVIYGHGDWSKGLGEIDYVPGVIGEIAVTIAPKPNKTLAQIITLGINASVFSEPLIMIAENSPFVWRARLFAGIEFAKKWK